MRVVGTELRAQVVRITPCRAHVKMSRGTTRVTFGGRDFVASQNTFMDWSPGTRVLRLERGKRPIPFWPLVDVTSDSVVMSRTVRLWPPIVAYWPPVED